MDFVKAFSSSQNGKDIGYILNDKALDDNHENMLYFVDDRNFIDLKVIDKSQLKSVNDVNHSFDCVRFL